MKKLRLVAAFVIITLLFSSIEVRSVQGAGTHQAVALTEVVNELPGIGGVVPIAIPLVVVEQLAEGQDFEMHDNRDGEFCYIVTDGEEFCIEDPGAPHNAQRGWLNLNHIFNHTVLTSDHPYNRTFERNFSNAGCPRQKGDLAGLKGYASGECGYAFPIIAGPEGTTDGDFIHGTSGVAEVGIKTVYEAACGLVYAPVFDRVYLREEMVGIFGSGAASPEGFPNGGGFSTAGGGGTSYYYHIVGFVSVEIDHSTPSRHVLRGTFYHFVRAE